LKGLILITGYSHYGRYMWNPSEELVKMLDGEKLEGYILKGLTLPVSFKRTREILLNSLNTLDPAAVICLGLAPSAKKLVVELVSVNTTYFEIPDTDKYRARLEPVIERSMPVARTSLPVERIARMCIEEKNLPIRPGVSIGTYLCNVAGYVAMSWASMKKRIGGFVHIPPHTDLAMRLGLENYLPMYLIRESLLCILRAVIAELDSKKPLLLEEAYD